MVEGPPRPGPWEPDRCAAGPGSHDQVRSWAGGDVAQLALPDRHSLHAERPSQRLSRSASPATSIQVIAASAPDAKRAASRWMKNGRKG